MTLDLKSLKLPRFLPLQELLALTQRTEKYQGFMPSSQEQKVTFTASDCFYCFQKLLKSCSCNTTAGTKHHSRAQSLEQTG